MMELLLGLSCKESIDYLKFALGTGMARLLIPAQLSRNSVWLPERGGSLLKLAIVNVY